MTKDTYSTDTYCIIMAGGTGSRFWPMSQAENPKQFLDILNIGQSMLQTTFRRFEAVCPRENIFVVTGKEYVKHVHEQIPGLAPWQVIGEPVRRNTAPCVAYAASVIGALNPEANIVVSPSDHAIFGEKSFVSDMELALDITRRYDQIVTLGVRPTSPNTSYGYIQFKEEAALADADKLHKVITFTEKPPLEVAKAFLATGEFFWNSGIFVWRLPVLKAAYSQFLPSVAQSFFTLTRDSSPDEVEYIYSQSEAISVDFGIMEKASNVHVLEASFGWSDVESWETLYSTLPPDSNGNCIVRGNVFAYDVKDTIVHIPAYRTLVLQGLEGYIVAGDRDTLLVCRRDQEDRIVKFASDVELAELSDKSRHKNHGKYHE
ncbi:MAG: mannose-1-phosphate guanylyltransferase [Bacteroidales bacterium]|nr:mannose-1-phosphate guanylyltransferase [Bacteroidales bacterium]